MLSWTYIHSCGLCFIRAETSIYLYEVWEPSTGFAVLLTLILCLQLVAFRAISLLFSQLSVRTLALMGNRVKMTPLLCFLKDSLAS